VEQRVTPDDVIKTYKILASYIINKAVDECVGLIAQSSMAHQFKLKEELAEELKRILRILINRVDCKLEVAECWAEP